MTKLIYKVEVCHASCIIKTTLLIQVATAWDNLYRQLESFSVWSDHTLWYLAPLPTFEEQKKEESRKWIDTAKLKMVRLYKSCDYGILLKLNFKATALLCRLFNSFDITAHIFQHINKQKVKILWLIISIIFHSIRWFKLPDFLSKWPWWKLTLHLWNHRKYFSVVDFIL